MAVLGIIAAVLGVLLASFVTIVLYFVFDRLFRGKGIKNFNITCMVIVLVITLAIHLVCIYKTTDFASKEFPDALLEGLKEIYSTFGGITFEGQELKDASTLASLFYFGSILWLAVTNALLIGIGVSYEFRCKLLFVFYRLFPYIFSVRPVFIFTTVSDDSLRLARNIVNDRELEIRYNLVRNKKNSGKHNNKPIIIFAGDEILPFDKTNELHQQIKIAGYYYFSFAKKEKENKKKQTTRYYLLHRLFGLKVILSCELFHFINRRDVYIFALSKDKDEKASEPKNTDIVFDDIESIAPVLYKKYRKVIKKIEKDYPNDIQSIQECYMSKYYPRIEYYALSYRDINYEFVDRSIVNRIDKVFSKEKDSDMLKIEKTLFKLMFGVNILNEAILSGEDLVLAKKSNFVEMGLASPKGSFDAIDINYSNKERVHKALVVGFGLNGQESLCHLFANCIAGTYDSANKKFKPDAFKADVIDAEIDKIVGNFINDHPMFVFQKGSMDTTKIGVNCKEDNAYARICNFYGFKENDDTKLSALNSFTAFPEIYYREENYKSPAFINTTDKILNGDYDSVIICLGDDEKNIECANSVFQRLRQNVTAKETPQKHIQIYVNIRDKDNNIRINWGHNFDDELFNNISLHIFGNADNLYSTRLFKITSAIAVDSAYNSVNAKSYYASNKYDLTPFNKFYKLSLYEKKTNSAGASFGENFAMLVLSLPKEKLQKLLDDKKTFEDNTAMKEKEAALNKEITVKDVKVEIKKDKNDNNLKNGAFVFKDHLDEVDHIFELTVNKKDQTGIVEFNKNNTKQKALPLSFAHYHRLNCLLNDKYFDEVGVIWYYLAQFDHMRWFRHMISYGRAYTKSFAPKVASNNIDPTDSGNQKIFKNIYKLSDCLAPYSKLLDFKNLAKQPKNPNYLAYHEEDYDYSIMLNYLNKSIPSLLKKIEKNNPVWSSNIPLIVSHFGLNKKE